MIPVPSRMEQDGARFHHAPQNNAQFKLMNYFWNFPFSIYRSGQLWVTETTGSKAAEKGGITVYTDVYLVSPIWASGLVMLLKTTLTLFPRAGLFNSSFQSP